MNAARTAGAEQESSRENTKLDHRYGQIGISALAAALRYSGEAKNPAPTIRRAEET